MSDRWKWWVVSLLPPYVAGRVWVWSERLGISLGGWAPHIFGQMLNSRGEEQ